VIVDNFNVVRGSQAEHQIQLLLLDLFIIVLHMCEWMYNSGSAMKKPEASLVEDP
jgi:hypothetical protein